MNKNDDNVVSVLQIILKYVVQGLIIAYVAFYIPTIYKTSLRKPTLKDITLIGITAAISMFLLDYYMDNIMLSDGYRIGAGLVMARNAFMLG